MAHLNAVDNHKLMALIKLWPECVQAVDGCYFDPACQASAIDAHALSEAWLKHALANAAGRVYGFTRGKGLPGEMYGLLLAREEAEELDRKQRQALPEPVRVGKATVAKFCCCVHDRKFNPIDELDVRSTLTPSDLDEHCWNLMFHRAVIRQLHRDTAFKVYRRELRRRYPGLSFPWDDNPHWDRNSIANLQWPRDFPWIPQWPRGACSTSCCRFGACRRWRPAAPVLRGATSGVSRSCSMPRGTLWPSTTALAVPYP